MRGRLKVGQVLHTAGDLPAVHPTGQADVEEHHVGGVSLHRRQSRRPISRHLGVVAGVTQQQGDTICGFGVVFHYQYPHPPTV